MNALVQAESETIMGSWVDPFYPVLDSAAWFARLLPLGVRLAQLRIKDKPENEIRAEVRRTNTRCKEYGCQLVVNDHWEIALDLGCDFVHLGQEDLDGADVAALKKSRVKLGISTHSEEELDRALGFQPDYIALGPVYPTILKKMPWKPQGLERVSQWKKRIGTVPLVAIGGLSVERAAGVFDAGADIVALVTDVTLNADPESRVSQWIRDTDAYR